MTSPPKASPRLERKEHQMSIFLLWYKGDPLSKSCSLGSFVFPFGIQSSNFLPIALKLNQLFFLSLLLRQCTTRYPQTGSGAYLSAGNVFYSLGTIDPDFDFSGVELSSSKRLTKVLITMSRR